jgi:hypothetical protein
MKLRKDQVRKMYRDSIVQIWGCGDKELDARIIKAVKRDVHYGADAPGEYCPGSKLEIYCENGIPNASDIQDFSAEMREFGCSLEDLKDSVMYHSEKWDMIDGMVNLLCEALGYPDRFYHEPYNNAVIAIQTR